MSANPYGADGFGMNEPGMTPEQPMPEPPQLRSVNIPVDEAEQLEIIQQCTRLKRGFIDHAREKKETMRKCYAYTKSKFVGGDLMPIPSTLGNDRDIQKERPKIFIPAIKQQVQQLFSYLKLTIFPNDSDYFRIRGKNEQAAAFENDLTEALKYKFKEMEVSEKLSQAIYNVCWGGNSAVFPTVCKQTIWEWAINPETMEYVPVQKELPPYADVEVFNPINFYIDPNTRDTDHAKWGYFSTKKVQEFKDSMLYFNTDKLALVEKEQLSNNNATQDKELFGFNGLQSMFSDIEGSVDYDLFYFPYLKTANREYRNMLVGIAGEQVLIRFHPNMFPKGMNPVVFFNWTPDTDSPYGTGPAEDTAELQRTINILYNYMIETMARMGNRFVASPDVDLSNLFGVAGGVARAENPGQDIVNLSGDYTEIAQLANLIGTVKAELQVTTAAQNPFQGSSNIDFKKTATEMQILQENSISVIREVVEHISITGIQRILERLMFLCADLYPEPFQVRVPDPMSPIGYRFIQADLSLLKSDQFVLELVSINPSQSKQAQVQTLMQVFEIIAANPQAFLLGEPILEQVMQFQGLKDGRSLLEQIKQRLGGMMNGAQQPGVPGAEAGMGADPQQDMGGVPQAPTGEEDGTIPPPGY